MRGRINVEARRDFDEGNEPFIRNLCRRSIPRRVTKDLNTAAYPSICFGACRFSFSHGVQAQHTARGSNTHVLVIGVGESSMHPQLKACPEPISSTGLHLKWALGLVQRLIVKLYPLILIGTSLVSRRSNAVHEGEIDLAVDPP